MLHDPVLLPEVLAYLNVQNGKIYVDGTFGAGGYSSAILEAAECTLIAIDRDPNVANHAKALQQRFPSRFHFIPGPFGDMTSLLASHGITAVDGIVLDIGVSSMQLDEAERGFSFMRDGPLDMRMSQQGLSAAEVVNSFEEDVLADIIFHFGDERKSRQIASRIVKERQQAPITTTAKLAEIVASVVRSSPAAIHPATRTFQALRIYVNQELEQLKEALGASESLLNPGGRLVVVTFHSLEDHIVKLFLKENSEKKQARSKYSATPPTSHSAFEILTKKPITPSLEELKRNVRARSAKLRAAQKRGASLC